ncbi:MAG: hypothetical protein ABFC73_15240 [Clostridiaceae bacterium]
MILNESAKALFGAVSTEDAPLDNAYPVWVKTDACGRTYYGVSDFWNLDHSIPEDADLSWLEWDGNETRIDTPFRENIDELYLKTIGIFKSWREQLERNYLHERFVILASFDDGSELAEASDFSLSFTLRFWKVREGSGPDENLTSLQPIIMEICNG